MLIKPDEPPNIYIAGPDGAKKSTAAQSVLKFLNLHGIEAEIEHFPQPVAPLSSLIHLVKIGRLDIPRPALELCFIGDRLDSMPYLQQRRQENPHLIFIFDRGPFDGEAYAGANCPIGEDPYKWAEWVSGCDQVFLDRFPVDVGLLMLPESLTETQARIWERYTSSQPDPWDTDLPMQKRVDHLFRALVKQRPEWNIVGVPVGGSFELIEGKVIGVVGEYLEKAGLIRPSPEGSSNQGLERH